MARPTNQPSDSISCLSMVFYATEHTSVGRFLHFKDNLWFWGGGVYNETRVKVLVLSGFLNESGNWFLFQSGL
jgi:hypothetical protein